ncbi:signal peptidase I [Paenibacillus lentus]|uniref:Signal peptidase I n=1 Tax=Paenibacillus lentus TaxID=1338368 RepID=A0A3S8RPF7_9BACL|nr:signal peptidase I [Paenibacillus lentus]AZK44836.1 signal peptidase I [Paenibacillus lentus]
MENLEAEKHTAEQAERHFIHNKWVRELWDFCKTAGIAFIIMLLLNMFVFNLSMVKGESMQPTLEERERLFVNKIVFYFASPSSGEIVVLKDPSAGPDKKHYLVKRVVATPGDTVEVRDGVLYVNGQILNEPYTDVQIQDGDFAEIRLGNDEFFVMGDNRHYGRSRDSRSFGSVKKKDIVGRAEFVFWPISKIRGL